MACAAPRSAPDGGGQQLHEGGVGGRRQVLPRGEHLVVGALHEPLLQLHHVPDVRPLLRLRRSPPRLGTSVSCSDRRADHTIGEPIKVHE